MAHRIALVTGANKGIGFAIAKALAGVPNIHVIIGSRDQSRGIEAVDKLRQAGFQNVETVVLDVSKLESIENCVKEITSKHNKIDILVNNAGISGKDIGKSFLDTDFSIIQETLQINTLGPLRLCQLVVPLMKQSNYGRIVNVGSGLGQLNDMNGKHVSYRFSKVSLNALTRIVSDETKEFNILVNVYCPGFVQTDMTRGTPAKKTPDEAAVTGLWLATLPDDGPRGRFFREKQEIAW